MVSIDTGVTTDWLLDIRNTDIGERGVNSKQEWMKRGSVRGRGRSVQYLRHRSSLSQMDETGHMAQGLVIDIIDDREKIRFTKL